MKTKILKLEEVLFDKETYPRQNPDFVTVARYINAMKAGAKFPAITVALLNKKYYLVDGLHRLKATKAIKESHIEAEVINVKDKREIYVEAVKKNIIHGHQFSTFEVVNITITLEKWNMSKSQISEIVRIPSEKLSGFVAKRAIRVTGSTEDGQSALRKTLNHLAGTEQAVDFDANTSSVKGGATQKELLDNLITLLENGWIDTQNEEVAERLIKLYKLLGNFMLENPIEVKEKKPRKKHDRKK